MLLLRLYGQLRHCHCNCKMARCLSFCFKLISEISFIFRSSETSVFPEISHSLPEDTVYSKTQEHILKIYCFCKNVPILKCKITLFISKITPIATFKKYPKFQIKMKVDIMIYINSLCNDGNKENQGCI